MQPQHKKPAPHMAQRGTSLIEILVVLVILVVGILSIVRLFPAGFIALRNAENNTFADRLAQGALEQLKKSGNGLPDAIYMYSTDEKGFVPSLAPDNFNPYPTTGTVVASYNDINKQRYISNETITVPAPHVIGGVAYPPLYVVNYGPIYLPTDSSPQQTQALFSTFLPVNSLPWIQQVGDSRSNPSDATRAIDNPVDILQAGQAKYLVDLNGGRLAVPPSAFTKNGSPTTYVNQDFVAVIGTANGMTVSVSLSLSSTYDGNWFDSTTVTNATFSNSNLPSGPWTSVVLYRPFRYMGSGPSTTFDTDPYEFAVYATNMGTASNTGVLAFNPVAAGQNGSQPLKARISYMTLDWHILHEDQNVSAGSSSIRLTLNHLKKIGDVQFDQSIYNGLISDATTPADIVMLNLDTGAVTSLNTNNVQNVDDNTGSTGAGAYQVSYQNGRITFPDNSPAQHLRFFYAGDADWALAVQKAPSVYNLVNLSGGVTADAAQLAKTGPTPNNYFVDTATARVYFPVCDAGKTVEFDGINYTVSTKAQPVIGEGTAAISTDYAANGLPYVNLSGSGLNAASILILPNDPMTGKPVVLDSLSFQAVRGISAQATVIWHEHNRWRTRTIDTLLTQTP